MAAANTDKFKKLARRWVGTIGSGGVADDSVTTIPLASTTNLPTDTAVVAVIDRVDANGTETSSLEESVIGVVSGSNLITCTRGVEGTAQAHSAGAVVEILFTNKGWGDLIDGILAEHSQAGAHTTDSIAEKTSGAGVTIDGVKLKDSGFTATGQPACKVYQSGDQTINTDSATQVTYDTESFDIGDNFDTANNKFVCPSAGIYFASMCGRYTSVVDGKKMSFMIYGGVNGATQKIATTILSAGTSSGGGAVSGLMQCAKDDEIKFFLHHDFGVSKNWDSGVQYCATIIKVA